MKSVVAVSALGFGMRSISVQSSTLVGRVVRSTAWFALGGFGGAAGSMDWEVYEKICTLF